MSDRMTAIQVALHNERVAKGKITKDWNKGGVEAPADEREVGAGGLHGKIIEWCNQQWPRWKFRHSRTDKKTHEELGVEDFTIFAPGNVTYHIEVKSKTGKLSAEQQGWIAEMKMINHTVYTVRSMEDFFKVVGAWKP